MVEVIVVSKRRVALRFGPSSPILHQLIDGTGRHLYSTIEEIRKVKIKSISVGIVVVGCGVGAGWRRSIRIPVKFASRITGNS
jgi:hypothetical protein